MLRRLLARAADGVVGAGRRPGATIVSVSLTDVNAARPATAYHFHCRRNRKPRGCCGWQDQAAKRKEKSRVKGDHSFMPLLPGAGFPGCAPVRSKKPQAAPSAISCCLAPGRSSPFNPAVHRGLKAATTQDEQLRIDRREPLQARSDHDGT